jgi:hypothetical protein
MDPMAPKHKGHRDPMMTRPPVEVGAIIRKNAKEAGIPYGDYIAAILSEYVGLSYQCPMPESAQTHKQQELDLPAA